MPNSELICKSLKSLVSVPVRNVAVGLIVKALALNPIATAAITAKNGFIRIILLLSSFSVRRSLRTGDAKVLDSLWGKELCEL